MKNSEELKTIRIKITSENIDRISSEYNYTKKILISKSFMNTYFVYNIQSNAYYMSAVNSVKDTQIVNDLDEFKALVLLYQI